MEKGKQEAVSQRINNHKATSQTPKESIDPNPMHPKAIARVPGRWRIVVGRSPMMIVPARSLGAGSRA